MLNNNLSVYEYESMLLKFMVGIAKEIKIGNCVFDLFPKEAINYILSCGVSNPKKRKRYFNILNSSY